MRLKWISVSALALVTAASLTVWAEDKPGAPGEALIPPAAVPAGDAAGPAAPPAQVAAAPAPKNTFSQEQLDQLLAPIALYPDQLLGQILMASSYPLQVIEAARWVQDPANRNLRGEALMNAMKAKGWDPSVMALVPFQRVLHVMNDRLDWMRDLGAAFLGQQADVMAAIQRLRHLAMAAGSLKQTPECHCTITAKGETITIATAQPGPVCIPSYNTRVAYGRWPYPHYPPMAFPAYAGVAYVPGIVVGWYPVVDVAWYEPFWGWSSFDWAASRIIVDRDRYAALVGGDPGFTGSVWTHDPSRRGTLAALGVAAAARAAAAGLGTQPAIVPGAAMAPGPAARGRAAAPQGFAAAAPGLRGPAARIGGLANGRPGGHGRGFAARSGVYGAPGPGARAGRFAAAAGRGGFARGPGHGYGGGRFAGFAPYAMHAGPHPGGGGRHFGAFGGGGPHFGGFGGGGAHVGGPASFGLGGGGGPHGGGGGSHGGGGGGGRGGHHGH